MTVSRKRKRPIVVDGRSYMWWVRTDEDPRFAAMDDRVLHLASESGELVVALPLGQPDATRHVEVEGTTFKGRDIRSTTGRFRCPDFCSEADVTPGKVAELARWCVTPDRDLVEVNYLGWPTRDKGSGAG